MRGKRVALEPEHLPEERRVDQHQPGDGDKQQGSCPMRAEPASREQREGGRDDHDPATVPDEDRGQDGPRVVAALGEEVRVMGEHEVARVRLLPREERHERHEREAR